MTHSGERFASPYGLTLYWSTVVLKDFGWLFSGFQKYPNYHIIWLSRVLKLMHGTQERGTQISGHLLGEASENTEL